MIRYSRSVCKCWFSLTTYPLNRKCIPARMMSSTSAHPAPCCEPDFSNKIDHPPAGCGDSKKEMNVEMFVKYGDETRYFNPPSRWKILTFAQFQDNPKKEDVEHLTRMALSRPIRSRPLLDRVSKFDRIAVLIEDKTRPSPKRIILRILLEELAKASVPEDHITIIVALGTHRGLTAEELKITYGEETAIRYPIFNHDCNAGDLVRIGSLRTGTPVKINRRVAESTFKIGIGSIFPHPMNGFGGGGKILFPGVADFNSILEHHLKYSFQSGSELGKLQGNPFYEEARNLAEMAGLDFILNAVLDHNDRLYGLVCGDPVGAHLAGVEQCKSIISRVFPKRADLTLISAFPYTEGLQIAKPLAPASMITKPGGTIILVARCTSALPEAYLRDCERFRRKYHPGLRKGVFDLFRSNRRIIEDGAPELNMSAAQTLLAQDEFRVILVSEEIPRGAAERVGFSLARNLNEAFSIAESFHPAPEVHVVPSGGVILPVMQEE